jgi:hypothetical protein
MLTSYLYMEMNHGITFNRVKDVNRRPVIWHLQMSTTVLLSLSLMFMYFFFVNDESRYEEEFKCFEEC